MFVELRGQLEQITYCNEENHYTVARVRVSGHRQLVTIVGTLPSITPGEVLAMKGSWDVHPKYGEQFKISSYETVIPATARGIERYLGSGLIRGIGPVMAKRLVDQFGTETLDIIETKIERLREVDGIGHKRIHMIKTAWAEQKEVREVMLFLQGHEISSTYASKIYRQYGKNSIRIVKENPYRLAADILGIGFLTADKIAEKLGIPTDSDIRAEAGILYTLQQLSDDGHVYYPYEQLLKECRKVLGIHHDIIATSLGKLDLEGKIIIDDLNKGEIHEHKKAVYLAHLHASETRVASHLKMILSTPRNLIRFDKNRSLEWVQRELNITLDTKQEEAISESLEQKVMVITGGPGTGKTTIINAIITLYRSFGLRVLLGAPTGRAAKRMSEAAGYEAKTIHRLLEYTPKHGGFRRNEHFLLDADLIVIDETSMVDTVLMHHLLKAVPASATLILVGDVDQLPSVGAGNVLKDIIDAGLIPVFRLDKIFRQSMESLIVVNAHRINNGEFPLISSRKDTPQDFYFVDLEDPEKVSEMILEMCEDRIPKKFGYDPVSDIQVITPMHRGVVGVGNLNAELQRLLNPSVEEFTRGGRTLKVRDKVMQIRNNYDKDVFNGDIGRIISINREKQELIVDYDGRPVSYDFTDIDEIVLAYAVSVHKAQGSEYPVVIMPLLTQHYILLQRNLLYTAITRGKRLVVIIGTKKALGIAIRNNRRQERYTFLKQRLRD